MENNEIQKEPIIQKTNKTKLYLWQTNKIDKYSFTYKWDSINLDIKEGVGTDLIRIVGAANPTSSNSADLEYYVKL